MLAKPMAQHIGLCPLDKIIPYALNPRTHSKTLIAQIAAIIREFGFNKTILVDTKSGVIAGHEAVDSRRICGS